MQEEEEEAVFSECRLLVLWVQEPPVLLGGEAPRGLQQLPGKWHLALGRLARGPPEEEEEEVGGGHQPHVPWEGDQKDCEELQLKC